MNYYELIGVRPDASPEEIRTASKAAYRRWLTRTNAPDLQRRQEAERMLQQIGEAETVLLDAARRREYDARRRGPQAPPQTWEAPQGDATDLLDAALRLIDEQRYPEAVDLARQAVLANGTNPWIWVALARAHHLQGMFDEAQYEYRQAIELSPDVPEFHDLLGDLYGDRKQWDLAEASARQAVHLDPGNPGYRHSLALIRRVQGAYDEAIPLLEQLVEEDPQNPSYRRDLAETYRQRIISLLFRAPDGRFYFVDAEGARTATALLPKALELVREDPGATDLQRNLQQLLISAQVALAPTWYIRNVYWAVLVGFFLLASIAALTVPPVHSGQVVLLVFLGGTEYLLVRKWRLPMWEKNRIALQRQARWRPPSPTGNRPVSPK